MDTIVTLGTAIGAVIGVLHGTYLYRRRSAPRQGESRARARLRAAGLGATAFALWSAFGTYLLVLFAIATLCRLASRLFEARPAAALTDRRSVA